MDEQRHAVKLLVDGMPLSTGGGVQVAIAFLENLRVQDDLDFLAVLPHGLYGSLPRSLRMECGPGRRIVLLQKNSKLDLIVAAAKLRRIEREFRADVVYTIFGPAYFKARAPHVVGFALPNLVYERDGILRAGIGTRVSDFIRTNLLRRASYWVVETSTVRDRLVRLLGATPERIAVIGNSVNPVLREFEPKPLPTRAPWRILVPSAYYRHKNLEVVPSVAKALCETNPSKNFEFQLTLDAESPEWKRIAEQAKVLGVEALVQTLGVLQLDELADAYSEARIVFLPTLREVSTAVYPEAFYFRRPLVTSDLDFARDLCGMAAIFIAPDDPTAMARAIHHILCDPIASRNLVREGERQLSSRYPTAEQKFTMQIELLEQLARARPLQRASA